MNPRQAAEEAEAIRTREWDRYLFACSRAERFEKWRRINRRLRDVEFWPLLAEVYLDAEDWMVGCMLFLRMKETRRKGRHLLMTAEERDFLAALPDPFTIYRGFATGLPKGHRDHYTDHNRPGWSWTLDRAKAIWFAHRWTMVEGVTPGLLVGTARKADVLAYFARRNEAEIVIDPDDVRDVREEPLPAAERPPG